MSTNKEQNLGLLNQLGYQIVEGDVNDAKDKTFSSTIVTNTIVVTDTMLHDTTYDMFMAFIISEIEYQGYLRGREEGVEFGEQQMKIKVSQELFEFGRNLLT